MSFAPPPRPQSFAAPHWAALGLAWLGGLGLLQQGPRLPGEGELAAALLLTVLLLAGLWCRPPRRAGLRCAGWALGIAGLAFIQGAWRAQQRLDEALPPAWEGRDLWLLGRVASLPQAIEGQAGTPGWRFVFELDAPAEDPAPGGSRPELPRRLLLSDYAPPDATLPAWRAGQRWRLLARLRRPHGLANPHAFDYELWLFEQNLRATGVLRPGATPRLLEAGSAWALDGWRQDLRAAIQRRVSDPGSAGLLVALSLGEQGAITRADWALFRNTGVSHLMSISGLHVTMLAWAAGLLAAALWRRGGRSCLWLPAPTVGLWMGVLAALLYALFSGWGVPAQRTVWMLLSLALLRQAGLRWSWPLCLLAAACVVTLLDPWALCQAGFWLSFVAVALLMAGGTAPPRGWRAQLGSAWRSQWVATLGLAPLTLLFFQQLSLVGLLANLLAIPLVSFVITPLALAGALLPGLWPWAAGCAQGLLAFLRLLDSWPGAVWILPVAPAWAQVAGLLAGLLLVLPLPWRLRLLGLPLALPLLWPAVPRPAPGELELLAADVGQGTAVLLRTRHHSLLYDAGPRYTPGNDAGQRVLLPLLHALGERELDLLVLSHRDQDHVGGAAALLAGLPVRGMLSSLEEGHVLRAAGPPHRACERGLHWVWDGVRFELLHPRAEDYGRAGLKPNALSCVLRVSSATGRSLLLSGDIEAAQELLLLQAGALAPVDLLMLPHHGSQTSSSAAFLDALAPRQAFAQAGYRNRFGHPAPVVLARLHERGVPLWTSPDCGALYWHSADAVPLCQRERARRYWHDPARLAGPPGPGLDEAQGF